MARLINAPHLREQPNEPYSDLIILAGAQAWSAWDKGKGIEWLNLCDHMLKVRPSEQAKPIILNGEQLGNIAKVKIAPAEQRSIKIYQCGELTEAQKTGICANLATNSRAENVHLLDINTGELLENFSGYIERTRQGDSVAEIVTQSAQNGTQQQKTDNLSPYIERRTENGKKGLYRITPKLDKDTGDINERVEWLCDPLKVVGMGKSEDEYFAMLEFSPFGATDEVLLALPLKDIGERTGWQLLRKNGLTVTNNTRLKIELADYLQDCGSKGVWDIVTATGWQNGAYILPNGDIIGQPTRPVYFIGQSANQRGYRVSGTLEDWQREIANNLNGNHSMMLGVACALCAPLIGLVKAESFGVHLFGGSSAGKTTTANIATSIYGHPDEIRLSWFSTPLALANEAQARNDGFMPLDEIGQGANKKQVGDTAYTLFNGIGKMQGAKEGGNRDLMRWRTLAFSTGETDLESYLLTAGLKTHAGQLVRLLNIPIQRATHFHHHQDGKTHADHLNFASRTYYGAIGRAWIAYLTEHKDDAEKLYHKTLSKWLERLPDDASAQVKRVTNRFALLETALQLATGLTGWTAEDNSEAMISAFNLWVNEFGFYSREEKQVIEQVNGWLLRSGARFIEYPFKADKADPRDMAGYRLLSNAERGTREKFYIFPQVYIQDVITGFNERQANEILFNAGMLERVNEGRGVRYKIKTPHKIDDKRTRCYVLLPLVESDEEETTEIKTE